MHIHTYMYIGTYIWNAKCDKNKRCSFLTYECSCERFSERSLERFSERF